jgi:hypothetical protein
MACISLLFSCEKPDQLFDELSGDDLKNGHKKGAVITVLPNGADDTENLLQAFADAAIVGPGTTIKLVEGEYFANYIEVYDFHGSLIGAGKERTIIKLFDKIDIESQEIENKGTTWWRMIDGDIRISDMSFLVPDGIVTTGDDLWYGTDLGAIFMFNNYNDEYQHPENSQNVLVENVNFTGGRDNGEGTWGTTDNVILPVWIGSDCVWPRSDLEYPLTKGNYVIKDCNFEKSLNAAEGFSLGEDATMSVSSCKFNGLYAALYFTANYNSKIFIKNNTFSNTTSMCDLLIEDIDWGFLSSSVIDPVQRCQYSVTGNVFNGSSSIPSIITRDHWVYLGTGERAPMLIEIKNNVFKLVEGGSGISLNNSQDAVVRNNRFSGSCTSGIAVDGFTWGAGDIPFAKNVLMLGNNFSYLNSSVANIYLGVNSMDCTIVGLKTDGKVVDEGVNNKIVGMQKGKPGHHVGPTIKDNFKYHRGKHK